MNPFLCVHAIVYKFNWKLLIVLRHNKKQIIINFSFSLFYARRKITDWKSLIRKSFYRHECSKGVKEFWDEFGIFKLEFLLFNLDWIRKRFTGKKWRKLSYKTSLFSTKIQQQTKKFWNPWRFSKQVLTTAELLIQFLSKF